MTAQNLALMVSGVFRYVTLRNLTLVSTAPLLKRRPVKTTLNQPAMIYIRLDTFSVSITMQATKRAIVMHKPIVW